MIDALFAYARLIPQGPMAWRRQLPRAEGCIYVLISEGEVVYIGQYPHAGVQRLAKPYRWIWAYWASTTNPSRAESKMLRWFLEYFHQLPSGNRGKECRSKP